MSDEASRTAVADVAGAGPTSSVRRGAKALVATGSRVLLVRERHGDGSDFWTLPGGGMHPTEGPADAVRRELAEELGCEAVVGDPVGAFWYAHLSTPAVSRYTVLDAALAGVPDPVTAEGVLESRWVDPERPPARTLLGVRHLLHERSR